MATSRRPNERTDPPNDRPPFLSLTPLSLLPLSRGYLDSGVIANSAVPKVILTNAIRYLFGQTSERSVTHMHFHGWKNASCPYLLE